MKRILFIFILTSSLLFGITINIPGNYSSIQEGIVASTNGDTVLVASGVYYEQLNFNGKNIVLTSNYIFSNDTSDISNTIIDGNQGGTAITLSSNEDSTSVVNGFTIQNSNAGAIFLIDADPVLENLVVENNTGYEYGAIFVYYNSNPILKNLIIKNNISTCDSRLASQVGGGGIYIKTNCNPIIEDCIISNNTASHGGGIRIGDNSNAIINNCTIKNNESLYDGGGIYIREALPKFKNILVENNIAGRDGGGLFCNQSESQLINSHFKLNSTGYNGGGIYLWESEIYLSGITLINNNAGNTRSCYGGGIYSDSSIVNFNPDTLCNIYNNMSYHADDIYSNTSIDVYVDTFTVLHPTGYQINPLENFTFSINWGKQEQIAQDLYVSPEGDDQNAGTTISDPLKTIGKALYLVDADSLNPRTIHLMDGTYSPTTNNESLPILGIDYVTISGVDSQQTIINTEDNECAFWLENIKDVSIKNIKINNARYFNIYTRNATVLLENVLVEKTGYLGCISSHSDIIITNCSFVNNEYPIADYKSSIKIRNSDIKNNRWGIKLDHSNAQIIDCIIDNNTNYGIYIEDSDFDITTSKITRNSSAGIWSSNSTGRFSDVTISNNYESGIQCENSSLDLSGVSIRYNTGATHGGGIRMEDSTTINFDAENLCSVYSNNADVGKDFFSFNCDVTNVNLDTSTVLYGTHYFATPAKRFSYDANTGLIEQFKNNLYVSPNGNDNNSGLSSESPLKTIDMALCKFIPDSLINYNIYLGEGVYSKSENNEYLPLNIPENTTLSGSEEGPSVIDGEGENRCINYFESYGSKIDGLTLKNANSQTIYSVNSDLYIDRTNLINGEAGFYCQFSKSTFNRSLISNTEYWGGTSYFSDIDFINCTLANIGDTNHGYIADCSFYLFQTNVRLLNSIYWDNGFMLFESYLSPCELSLIHSNIQYGLGNFGALGAIDLVDTLNNQFAINPNFKEPDNNDYSLSEGSLCINAGTSFYEINGDTLINLQDKMYIGPAPDIGAFESNITDNIALVLPIEFKLNQNYPNPFNPITAIDYQLATESHVNLSLYDITGRKIKTLINDIQIPGYYTFFLNASSLSSGMYIYRLVADDFIDTKKMLLLK